MATRLEASEAQLQSHSNLRRAVVDVGTNSVKLLVAEITGRTVSPVLEQSEQTRLGRGFYPHHRLQSEAIAQTARACASFVATAQELDSTHTRLIATSAARDAVNADELCAAVEAACGLPLEIISGEQEADWAFCGVTSDPALAHGPLLILDVGGGSTEFILGENGHAHFRQSFPLGSVRWLEQFPHVDPPTPDELATCRAQLRAFLATTVRPALPPHWPKHSAALRLVGTGGAATILARLQHGLTDFNRAQIEQACLTQTQVSQQCERLWQMPLATRRELPGLPPDRADVILFGVAIYEAVMQELALTELRVSTRGLRFAAVLGG